MVYQIDASDWDEVAHPVPLCVIQNTVLDIEKKFEISFFEYLEDGLGTCFGSYVVMDSIPLFLRGHISKNSKDLGVQVFVRSFELTPLKVLKCLKSDLKVITSWINEKLGKSVWVLYRVCGDQNVLIHKFLDKESALFYQSVLQSDVYKHSILLIKEEQAGKQISGS